MLGQTRTCVYVQIEPLVHLDDGCFRLQYQPLVANIARIRKRPIGNDDLDNLDEKVLNDVYELWILLLVQRVTSFGRSDSGNIFIPILLSRQCT